MVHSSLQLFDYIVFIFYFLVVSFYGYYIYKKKKSFYARLLSKAKNSAYQVVQPLSG